MFFYFISASNEMEIY